jgi:hypothetical protein
MALVVDLDTSSKEVWKKNLSWQATTLGTEEKRNRSEARDLKGPGYLADCSVTDKKDDETNKAGRKRV